MISTISRFLLLVTAALLAAPYAEAQAATGGYTGNPIADGIISTLVYSAIGIVMAVISYKVVDCITPGDLSKSLSEDSTALGILAGAMVLGICIIIAAVISS